MLTIGQRRSLVGCSLCLSAERVEIIHTGSFFYVKKRVTQILPRTTTTYNIGINVYSLCQLLPVYKETVQPNYDNDFQLAPIYCYVLFAQIYTIFFFFIIVIHALNVPRPKLSRVIHIPGKIVWPFLVHSTCTVRLQMVNYSGNGQLGHHQYSLK